MPNRSLARIATAVSTVLLTAACSTAVGAPDGQQPAAEAPGRLTHALPDDPARMVLPATGAETRWTQGLNVFGQQVARAAAAECARAGGFGLTEEVPVAFIPFGDLPDLGFLGRHGFGRSAEVPAGPAAPAPARPGEAAEIDRCRAVGATAAEQVAKGYQPLQRAWFGALDTAMKRDAAAGRALRDLPGCLAGEGYAAAGQRAFFALVDRRLMGTPAADLARVNTELGAAYAHCMRPVEAVREPVRRKLRERFLADHAGETRDLRTVLFPALHRAGERYGVRLVFPAP
ncbi:hypothetical protein OG206_31325 [Streptomyces sp. NBC_01341]|uniref:hypothetical protein n=1 Tax=Streptomyces sp. NBC_01341 TaxID=2903831 RepID=UPI002E0E925D|nr:hypothetical protein OG206_31325 [Streptomyces sp. NBC_01341]